MEKTEKETADAAKAAQKIIETYRTVPFKKDSKSKERAPKRKTI